MSRPTLCRPVVLVASLALGLSGLGASETLAQGVSTSAIGGTVRSERDGKIDGASVLVRNSASGFQVKARTRDGRFLVLGLEVGAYYSVTVRAPGFREERRDRILLRLGEPLETVFLLRPEDVTLPPLVVEVDPDPPTPNLHGGTATRLAGSLVHQLPTLDRDFYDFVRLVPQVSTRIGFPSGISGGGVGFRFNSFLINGVPERTAFANATPALAGGRSLPLEAVSEYQVLLAPYDVRYGDFAGALVNTITRSGTNELRGSAFAFARNDRLARGGDTGPSPYDLWQYGLSLSGPVLRDRLLFFVATELRPYSEPAVGPYLGQPAAASPRLPIAPDLLARADAVLLGHGLEPGSAGPVENHNPLANVYARVDLAVPRSRSRVALWYNYTGNVVESFDRADPEVFPLSSYQLTSDFATHLAALQVHTAFDRAGGGHNEFLVARKTEAGVGSSAVRQPLVDVEVPAASGGRVTLRSGAHGQAQGGDIHTSTVSLEDVLTLPLGSSVLTLGVVAQRLRVGLRGVPGSFGEWTFSSLDSLAAGHAERYEIRRSVAGGDEVLRGGQYGVYAGFGRPLSERVHLTLGARLDWLGFDDAPPNNPAVDSIFGRRTDSFPGPGPHLSPRLGFTWTVSPDGRDRVRGGLGLFSGRPPLAWFYGPFSRYGLGVGSLRCGTGPGDAGPPPALFEPDLADAPTACANGEGLSSSPRGDVNLLAPDLSMARTLRASLAFDRELSNDLTGTVEALLTRNLSDYVFTNLNLRGPVATDGYGRVLYGSHDATGLATPALRSEFAEVIDLVNTNRNWSWQASARLEKQFTRRLGAVASYTATVARDVQSPLRTGPRGTVNWASRAVSDRHDDFTPAASLNDVPHRIAIAVAWSTSAEAWPTRVALYWIGESGNPFTYRAWGVGRRGDLNADGSNLNDPIYVPRDAFDLAEIRFSGQSALPDADNSPPAQDERVRRQQASFEELIQGTGCLRSRRGRLLERNACREPWSHTTILSLRQGLPLVAGAFEAQLDVFNLLNLFDRGAGLRRVAIPELLEHVGQSAGATGTTQPEFRYDPDAPRWIVTAAESTFQLQLGLRYRF